MNKKYMKLSGLENFFNTEIIDNEEYIIDFSTRDDGYSPLSYYIYKVTDQNFDICLNKEQLKYLINQSNVYEDKFYTKYNTLNNKIPDIIQYLFLLDNNLSQKIKTKENYKSLVNIDILNELLDKSKEIKDLNLFNKFHGFSNLFKLIIEISDELLILKNNDIENNKLLENFKNIIDKTNLTVDNVHNSPLITIFLKQKSFDQMWGKELSEILIKKIIEANKELMIKNPLNIPTLEMALDLDVHMKNNEWETLIEIMCESNQKIMYDKNIPKYELLKKRINSIKMNESILEKIDIKSNQEQKLNKI